MRPFLVALILLTAQQAFAEEPLIWVRLQHAKPYKLSAEQVEALKATILPLLKDETGAKFGNAFAGTEANGKVLACIDVNAKNSFGGFSGWHANYATLSGSKVNYELELQYPCEVMATLH